MKISILLQKIFFQSILSEGGLYAFQLRATEILENGVTFGEQAITNVTLVITDQNDMLPTFNRYVSKMLLVYIKIILFVYLFL